MARVGLLEDNVRIARLCSTLLHYAGHEVTVYQDSKTCLHALLWDGGYQSAALPVEVLILDLALPDMHGIEVLRHLTTHPHTRMLPIILCTAATRSEVAKALVVAPHANLVEKPFKLQTLVSAISTALSDTSESSRL